MAASCVNMEHFGDGWHRGDVKKIRNSVREDNDVPNFCDDSKYLCNGPQAVRGRGHIPKPVNLKEIQTTLDEKVRTACAG